MFSKRNATSGNLLLVLAFIAGCSSYPATINNTEVDAGPEGLLRERVA
jgi:starvation-inducible outer membrane lipoprotein